MPREVAEVIPIKQKNATDELCRDAINRVSYPEGVANIFWIGISLRVAKVSRDAMFLVSVQNQK